MITYITPKCPLLLSSDSSNVLPHPYIALRNLIIDLKDLAKVKHKVVQMNDSECQFFQQLLKDSSRSYPS